MTCNPAPDTARVYVNLDAAQHGIGTASCGPGTLPRHCLEARPTALRITLRSDRPRSS